MTQPNTLSDKKLRFLDLFERVVLLLLFGFLISRAAQSLWNIRDESWLSLTIPSLLVFSEGIVITLLLFRKSSSKVSPLFGDWVLAFVGSFLPLIITPVPDIGPLVYIGFPLMLCGMAWQIFAKMILGLRFGVVPANRGICIIGPYRVMRHPMYFGYFLTHCGFLISSPSLWNAFCYLALYITIFARIIVEERLLLQDPEYQRYAARVRTRMLPGIF